ncbi:MULTISPECIES: hypothetical protein [Paenibacillus]|uniref:YqzN/YkzM domain-containing protein n=1 Tax=Paenibacillus albilobatus TaxID=2716884 RepID=A0A919XFT5_9BACL|nr:MULTISPECIES: hypothetical protein [Paenibacillus]MDR9855972.1 hypothetical protein [Paenibacillus sp. VCA1]GIO32016.1 hypothetical protein J2TS6_31570 [Paenibacillus albilobatus]
MAVKKTAQTGSADGAPRYKVSELAARAEDLFDVKEEVMAGAFYGEKDKTFTVAEAKAKIEQFMKAKVD